MKEISERGIRLNKMQDNILPRDVIKLHLNQLPIMASSSRLILAAGGWGSGKTFVATVWALKNISLYPDTLGLIIANSYSQLAKSTLKPLCELMDLLGIRWNYGIRPRYWTTNQTFPPNGWKNVLSIANGCCVICQSNEKFELMAGTNLGWAWLDECQDTKLDCFKLAQSRIRDKNGPLNLLITTTPPLAGRSHWLYPLFYGDIKEKLPGVETFRLSTRDNPELPDDYVDKLEAMGKTQAQACVDGLWINANNNACFEFDRLIHVKEIELNKDLPLIISADQNVAPMGATILQVNREKRTVNILDEIWIENNATTRKCAEIFISKYSAWDGDVIFFCDATSEKRNTLGSPNDIEIMRQTLKSRFPSARDGSDHQIRKQFDGVIAINALLNPLGGPPRLTISSKCKNLIRDLEGLCWKPGSQSIDKESNPSLSHECDSIRYVIGQYFPVMGAGITGFNNWSGPDEEKEAPYG